MFQCIGQYLYSFSFKHIKTPPSPLIFVMFSYLLTRLCFARLFLSILLSCLRYCCVLGYSKHIFHLCCQQGSCKYLEKKGGGGGNIGILNIPTWEIVGLDGLEKCLRSV